MSVSSSRSGEQQLSRPKKQELTSTRVPMHNAKVSFANWERVMSPPKLGGPISTVGVGTCSSTLYPGWGGGKKVDIVCAYSTTAALPQLEEPGNLIAPIQSEMCDSEKADQQQTHPSSFDCFLCDFYSVFALFSIGSTILQAAAKQTKFSISRSHHPQPSTMGVNTVEEQPTRPQCAVSPVAPSTPPRHAVASGRQRRPANHKQPWVAACWKHRVPEHCSKQVRVTDASCLLTEAQVRIDLTEYSTP